MENIKYIKFHNKRIILEILCMHIDKHNKIKKKSSEEKIETGPGTSLKINSIRAEDLWLVGPNDKHNDFPNRYAWLWKSECLELQSSLLFDTKKLKTLEIGWLNRRCQISAEVDTQGDKWAWGIDMEENLDKT